MLKKKFNKHEINKKIINNETPVILEVGAHYGEDSVKFLDYFPKAKLYCFEPDPRNIYIFKKYIKDKRINLFEVAVANHNCDEADFYQSYLADYDSEKMFNKYHWISKEDYVGLKLNRSGASSLKQNPLIDCLDITKVRTITLDSWLKEHNIECVDLLWIDVQGAEADVIEGARNSLDKIRFIWIEYGELSYEDSMNRKETIRLLKSYFSVIRKYSKNSNKGDLLLRNKYL